MTNYARGRSFEYRVRNRLLADGAVHVVRAAGSRSPADLYAFYPPASKLTSALTRVVLVQCKNNGRAVPAAARAELMALAAGMRATALLAKPGPNNRGVIFEPVITPAKKAAA